MDEYWKIRISNIRMNTFITNKSAARIVSFFFHPMLMPALSFLLLMNINFYFSNIPFVAKGSLFLTIFSTTFLLPGIVFLLMSTSPEFDLRMEKRKDRVFPLMITIISYYVGYFILSRIPIFPVYKVFMISSILTLIVLLVITMWWKVSLHMAGIAGLTGAIVALSFRLGHNSSILIMVLVMIAGVLGTSRLILEKHSPAQIFVGYIVGFTANFLIIYFI